MTITAYADENQRNYLTKIAVPKECTVGLIVGHPLDNSFYILHMTRTSPRPNEKHRNSKSSLVEILEVTVAEHAKQTTRLLSGGTYILGIFVVSDEEIVKPFSSKVKGILNHVYSRLSKNEFLYGNKRENAEKLVLHYNSKTEKFAAASYNITTMTVSPVELKFNHREQLWGPLECKFEINESLLISNVNTTLHEQLKLVITNINSMLKAALYLFDGEFKDRDESLHRNNSKTKKEENLSTVVTILLPAFSTSGVGSTHILDSKGVLKINGIVASSLWLPRKAPIEVAIQAVQEDIIRSLSARFAMHIDSLTEGERGIFNGASSIHETPRRVLIPLPDSKVMLSDYLFPGEGPQEAISSLEDILDTTFNLKTEINDVEGQADLMEYYSSSIDSDSLEDLPEIASDTNKFMYVVGATVAILALLVSLLIHFIKE